MTIHRERDLIEARRTVRRARRALSAALGRGEIDPDLIALAEMILEVGRRTEA